MNPSKVNWITTDLIEKINARNLMKKKLDKDGGNSHQWKRWTKYRNQLNKEIKNAKKKSLKDKINKQVHDSKCLWDGVKEHLGWKSSLAPEMLVKESGETVQCPTEMSEEIQQAFQCKLKSVERELRAPTGNFLYL